MLVQTAVMTRRRTETRPEDARTFEVASSILSDVSEVELPAYFGTLCTKI